MHELRSVERNYDMRLLQYIMTGGQLSKNKNNNNNNRYIIMLTLFVLFLWLKKTNKIFNYRVLRVREILLSGPQSLLPYVISLELNQVYL